MDEMKVTITTLSPVVLTTHKNSPVMTETADYFSGTLLRGILADQYIKKQGLSESAHGDKEFYRAFFGNLCFIDATPVYQGQRAMVLPLSLQKNKKGTQLRDLLIEEPEVGYKSLKGLGCIQDDTVHMVSVRKNVTLHMGRETDKERLSGKSVEGHVYNYESIEEGQVFEGYIRGPEDDLKQLKKSLGISGKGIKVTVGRSKYTQYGLCRLVLGDVQPIAPAVVTDWSSSDDVYVMLDTPYIPSEEIAGDAPKALHAVTALMNGSFASQRFAIPPQKIFADFTEIYNFVGIWHMRRPGQTALAAGSVFVLHKETGNWTKEELEFLVANLQAGLGERVEEGFGQMRLWSHGILTMGSGSVKPIVEKTDIQSDEVKQIARQIIMQRILEQMRVYAYEDVQQLGGLNGKAHLFARLEGMLGVRTSLKGIKARFQREVDSIAADGKKIGKSLHDIKLGHRELFDILTGRTALPYQKDWYADVFPEHARELMKCVDFTLPDEDSDELFYEYWQWFFLHARKKAVRDKGAMDE
jgi:CRISPR-associated protein Csx10